MAAMQAYYSSREEESSYSSGGSMQQSYGGYGGGYQSAQEQYGGGYGAAYKASPQEQYGAGGYGAAYKSSAQEQYGAGGYGAAYNSSPQEQYGGGYGGGYQSTAQKQSHFPTASRSLTAPAPQYGGGYGQQQQLQKSSSYSSSSQTMMTVFGNDPFCEITPSSFPPGTDRKVVECFNRIDRDGNGVVDDKELQAVLSASCSQSFSLRTVHLLMYEFTHSNKRMIGPKEFIPLMNCLQQWRAIFTRFDRDRNGSIDSMELGNALTSLGYCVSPVIVNLLVAKFTKSGLGGRCSLQYDNFIECCLTVKGLTETFNVKKDQCGKASFGYEEFLLNVLPFIIA